MVKGRLAHNTLHSAIASFSIVMGGFTSNVLVARLLGVEAAGVIAFATWAVTVGVMLGDLGVPGAIARYLPDLHSRGRNGDADGLVRWLSRVNLAGACCISVGMICFGLLGGLYGQHGSDIGPNNSMFWLLVGVACFAQTAAGLSYGYLKGMQDFGLLSRLTFASCLLQIIATIVGSLTFGVTGALVGAIVVALLPAGLVVRILPTPGRAPHRLMRRVRRFAIESWASYLVTSFAWARMEIVFLQASWGSHSVALFAASLTLSNLATQGPLLLTGGLLPHLAQQKRGDNAAHRPQAVYGTSIRMLAFLLIPACLGTAAIAPALVPAIYGAQFSGAVPSTIVLLCGSALAAPASVAFTYLLAMERTRFVLAVGGLAAAMVILSGLTLVPAFGAMAAASVRAATQVAVAIVTMWYLHRYLDCPTPVMSLVRITAAALTCAAAALACVLTIPGIAGIVVGVCAGVVVYGVSARLLRALSSSDAERLSNALGILPRLVRIPASHTLRLISP